MIINVGTAEEPLCVRHDLVNSMHILHNNLVEIRFQHNVIPPREIRVDNPEQHILNITERINAADMPEE